MSILSKTRRASRSSSCWSVSPGEGNEEWTLSMVTPLCSGGAIDPGDAKRNPHNRLQRFWQYVIHRLNSAPEAGSLRRRNGFAREEGSDRRLEISQVAGL